MCEWTLISHTFKRLIICKLDSKAIDFYRFSPLESVTIEEQQQKERNLAFESVLAEGLAKTAMAETDLSRKLEDASQQLQWLQNLRDLRSRLEESLLNNNISQTIIFYLFILKENLC